MGVVGTEGIGMSDDSFEQWISTFHTSEGEESCSTVYQARLVRLGGGAYW